VHFTKQALFLWRPCSFTGTGVQQLLLNKEKIDEQKQKATFSIELDRRGRREENKRREEKWQ
jgi:hypothetical protein